ncbi:uncharacterized protein rab11fip1a isoform X1 [Eucyclogobius newberryi]|uniref:uncharacterized protein rab11fip1a isoform X1 n=1 Tax=Eucyclogobius newberryi TaxID=166745 RepID=UPI003B5A2794
MSLVDQSQQWYPTSVRVTVHQAKDLRAKGKNGTNDAYAIIQVAKDKFSTTVSEKCVSPVWKEEAAFDLPLFHPGNADRCTLHVIVMHRAQVGLDKFLGQAVVNLLALHDNKARQRTDWFKLVDKAGKEDKARGQVLLDIQFLRNNISASMLDLSMQDKPRSRISKIKDKVRGKKKDSFSDSASAIVPSVSRVLTDSEGEGDSVSLSQSPGVKKKSKFKTLFAPKSNLQRNVSQSMSTLGTLPEKNSSLSSSRSSGLNIDSPDVKKKFKFLGHKRTGSSDSKVSQGPFSLLNRSKQNDLNSLCINGSHVYAEEAEAKSGSTMSLNSSGHGSVEDIHKQPFDVPVDVPAFSVNVPASSSSQSAERALLEQQRHQEEQRKIAEARRLEEEERRRADAFRLQQEEERRHQKEQERKRQLQEDEAKRRKHREEEDMRRRQEEVQRQEAAEEEQRQRQEQLKAEEQKKQEEASMSERLTSLFGMIRKKEEKKEEVVPEEPPTPIIIQDLPVPKQSTKPFEEVSLSSSPPQSPNESKPNSSAPIPSAMVFLNRTAKVKPRLTDTLKPEPTDYQTTSSLHPSPESPPASVVPSETSDCFRDLHVSLAPRSKDLSDTSLGSTDDLSSPAEDSENMADKKRRAPVPQSYTVNGTQSGGREILNPAYVEPDTQQTPRLSLPLPDYETLFPQKRHGVQGHTHWDHIIAEVNQKKRDGEIVFTGNEMSVDGPEEHQKTLQSSSTPVRQYRTHTEDRKPVSSKSVAAPQPPKEIKPDHYKPPTETTSLRPRQNSSQNRSSIVVPDSTQKRVTTDRTNGESGSSRKVLHPASAVQAPGPRSQIETDRSPQENVRISQRTANREAPTARPRQKPSGRESTLISESNIESDRKAPDTEFDPFPNNHFLSNDPWGQTQPFQNVDLFTDKEKKPEEQGMTPGDLDSIFSSAITSDPFTVSNISQPKQSKAHTPQRPTEPEHFYDREDSLPADTVASTPSSEPLSVILEEQVAGGLSGGKSPISALVSPSEVQPVSVQTSNGGGLAMSQRRPHAVKPLNPADSHPPSSTPAFKEIKGQDSAPSKYKVSGSSESGPYTQLTQEELITMVVKQQVDLSKKDSKIVELEEYIDNLLVRVIEEKPSILNSLDAKPH